jgi:hypothetical protein
VVPARHSRTKWLLAFGAMIASTPAFALHESSSSRSFACRLLTVSQNRSGCTEPVLTADSPQFSCSAPPFLQPAPAPAPDLPSSSDVEDDAGLGDGDLADILLDEVDSDPDGDF